MRASALSATALDRETLTYRPVCRDKLVMITPNNERYRAFQRAGAYGRDLLGEPMIVRGGGSGTRKEFDRYLRSLGRDQQSLQIVARMNQADAVASSVAGGLGGGRHIRNGRPPLRQQRRCCSCSTSTRRARTATSI